jgi:uncharacterized membrane protein
MFILFVGLVIGFVLLMDARSKISRLQTRVKLLEQGQTFEVAPSPVGVETEETLAVSEPVALEMETVRVETPAIEQPQIAPDRVHSFALDAAPKRSWSFSFEDLFGRRLPIWAGGITLAIAGVLIAKYAIDAGIMKIFTPWVRIFGGLFFGTGLIARAELASRHEKYVDDPRIRQALSGAGIATLYATVLVAANVYALIGPFAAFVALAAVTAGALALSIRFGAPSAVLGLAGGLAARAMIGGMQPNVPTLAVYLALTIAGIAGVSRMQRWAWLGIIALAGGAGWSLWMIAASSASSALGTMGSLSLGGLVLLLAIGLPMLVLDGPRAAMFRSATTLVGAAQLALMVALGGFSMLNWGLFALLAAAGQWLNWRERGFAIVPTIGLVLSVALLTAWPNPALSDFVIVGLALALIHGGPLMLSVWNTPPVFQQMVELCGLALAALMVPFVHYYPFFFIQTPRDMEFAWVSLGASLIPAIALALGWARFDRGGDRRFALATATTAILLDVAFCFATTDWLWPIGAAAIGAAILFFGKRAKDVRTQTLAGVFAAVAVPLLAVTGIAPFNDWERLAGFEHEIAEPMAFVRWAFLGGVVVIFAMRAGPGRVAKLAQVFAALLIYGATSQVLPVELLPLVPAIALVGLAVAHSRIGWPQLAPTSATLGVLIAAWAIGPVGIWLTGALASLGGVPMVIDPNVLTATMVGKQLLVPALLIGVALWLWRAQMDQLALRVSAIGAAIMGMIAVHALYRLGFTSVLGTDFTGYGIAQRVAWEALLIGSGWGLSRGREALGRRRAAVVLIAAGALHMTWYTLLLHNPLWTAQAVGGLPVINLIAPAFGLLFAGGLLLRKLLPDRGERFFQWLVMLLVAGFTWATLRQAFHGTLLVAPGVSGTEDILRSILAIGLAVGFLLWGIRTQLRDWRIASLILLIGAVGKVFLFDASGLEGLMRIGSFVALGFSLIGIGWLYSRQLTHAAAKVTE